MYKDLYTFVLIALNIGVTVLLPYLVQYNSRNTVYFSSYTIFLTEVFKVVLSLCLEFYDKYKVVQDWKKATLQTVQSVCDGGCFVSVLFPAVLYSQQNTLTNLALPMLPLQTYVQTYQLRIPFTAVCAVLQLDQRLTGKQWVTMGVLTMGVILATADINHNTSDAQITHASIVGVLLVITAALFSGFSCVFQEGLNKTSIYVEDTNDSAVLQFTKRFLRKCHAWITSTPPRTAVYSVYATNTVLAFTSCFITGTLMIQRNHDEVLNGTIYKNIPNTVYMTVLIQALGGILISMVVKHTSNIVKCFLSAISIIQTILLDTVMSQTLPSLTTTIGCILVILSTLRYNMQKSKPSPISTSINKHD